MYYHSIQTNSACCSVKLVARCSFSQLSLLFRKACCLVQLDPVHPSNFCTGKGTRPDLTLHGQKTTAGGKWELDDGLYFIPVIDWVWDRISSKAKRKEIVKNHVFWKSRAGPQYQHQKRPPDKPYCSVTPGSSLVPHSEVGVDWQAGRQPGTGPSIFQWPRLHPQDLIRFWFVYYNIHYRYQKPILLHFPPLPPSNGCLIESTQNPAHTVGEQICECC